jgi:diguanylate cyclase (GGDEF)-like protein
VADSATLELGRDDRRQAVPRLELRAARRRQVFLMIYLSCAMDAAILALFALAGTVSALVPAAYLAAGLTVTTLFVVLSETHVSERFRDHYMTLPQSAASAAVQLVFVAVAPQVSVVFLSVLFIIVGFGALRGGSRQAAAVWTTITVGLAALFLLTDLPIGIATDGYIERAAAMLCFVLTIGRCMFVGLYGSMLRETLYRRGQQLSEAKQRIEELARHDDLTGALNRRAVMAEIAQEIDRLGTQAGARPCAVGLIDLDRFKSVNDSFGHPVGDEVLRTFAVAVSANIREPDRFGRYGGEEFALLLPGQDVGEAARTLDRVRAVVAELDWSALAPGLRVTMSAGVAAAQLGEAPDAVLGRADAALYKAKLAGRNCIVAA